MHGFNGDMCTTFADIHLCLTYKEDTSEILNVSGTLSHDVCQWFNGLAIGKQ